jgi:hypothetical protein
MRNHYDNMSIMIMTNSCLSREIILYTERVHKFALLLAFRANHKESTMIESIILYIVEEICQSWNILDF